MDKTTFPRRVTGDQRLALAVILQAMEDARNPSIDRATRLEATEFLNGQRLEVWWRLAGLNPMMLPSMTGTYARSRAS